VKGGPDLGEGGRGAVESASERLASAASNAANWLLTSLAPPTTSFASRGFSPHEPDRASGAACARKTRPFLRDHPCPPPHEVRGSGGETGGSRQQDAAYFSNLPGL